MIDLHCHTKYSDGTWTVTELLQKASEKQIEILAITDHDTVAAHFELENLNIKDYYQGKIIIGSEINCVFGEDRRSLPVSLTGKSAAADRPLAIGPQGVGRPFAVAHKAPCSSIL